MPAQWISLIFLVVLFVIMYIILIVPQKRRDKKYREMLSAVKVGDKIVTIGGFYGTIVSIKDEDIVIENGADRTKLTLEKSAIKTVLTAEKAE